MSQPTPPGPGVPPVPPPALQAEASGNARQTNVIVYGNWVTSLPGTDPAWLTTYLEYLERTSADIRLSGMDARAADPQRARQLQLANVYVNLETELTRPAKPGEPPSRRKSPGLNEESETLPVSALEAAGQHRRLVLTGQPGSGKTTFIRYLCLCLARHGLDAQGAWLDRLKAGGWPAEPQIPLVIELRYFARSLPAELSATESARRTSPQPRDLWDFFVQCVLLPQNLAPVAPLLEQALREGRALVIFEGLDEVPSGEQRRHVQCAIQRFAAAAAFARSRILVTCRTRAYAEPSIRLDGFETAPLKDFAEPRIRDFCSAWYAELARLEGRASEEFAPRAQRLFQAIQVPSLWTHAGRPMLLTVMANLHATSDRLPEDRAQVYADMVELLVDSWDNVRMEEWAPLRQLLGLAKKDKRDLIRFLGEQAFAAHRRVQGQGHGDGPDALADLPRHGPDGLLEQLKKFCGSYDLADQFIDAIGQRAGLLMSPDPGAGVYTFPHRSFQEYLAGMHLANGDDFVEDALKWVTEAHASPASAGYWDEAVRWAAGWIAHVNEAKKLWREVVELAERLAEGFEKDPERNGALLILAAEVLLELGESKRSEARKGPETTTRVVQHLVGRLTVTTVPVPIRARAGQLLGRLGDPRKGVGLGKDGLPELDWIEIPAGPFWIGSTEQTKKHSDKTPGFECSLIKEPYRVARYPVTVRQYQAFVRAGGYQQKKWWTPAGWQWVTHDKVTGPESAQPVFETPNHPQVGVCWFEAKAFCAWLTAQLRANGKLPANARIDLPTEAQWERAARGTDGREYPWGGRPGDPEPPDLAERCNYGATQLGSTSAVGIFPRGVAACGAADLVGNTWEWCRAQWLGNYQAYETRVDDSDSGEGTRVLRGGSWIGVSADVRCAYRGHDAPGYRSGSRGFRCVWA
jgi:formylglycine-generating enzyme required for sulfatase activity